MKILLATSSINETGGGISSYAIDFITEFRFGNDFLVISNEILDNKYSKILLNYQKVLSDDLSYQNLKHLLSIIETYNPDVIINSNFMLLSIAIPFVSNKIIKLSISHFVDGKLAIIAGYNHRYYDTLVSLSSAGVKSLKKNYWCLDIDKMEVVYNFFRTRNFVTSNLATKGSLNIVFPGGSSIHKNPFLVYRILTKLQKKTLNFKFYWLGNTLIHGAHFMGDMYISDLFNKDKRIVFTGNLTRDKAVEIIQESDIFLLPSKKEGCPISLLEAMSVGTIPIVSNSKHAASEIIHNGFNGFLLSSSQSNKYVHLIDKIISNPEKFLWIKNNCIKTFQTKLAPEIWKIKMDRLLFQKNFGCNSVTLTKYLYYSMVIGLESRLALVRVYAIIKSLYYALLFRFYWVIRRICFAVVKKQD